MAGNCEVLRVGFANLCSLTCAFTIRALSPRPSLCKIGRVYIDIAIASRNLFRERNSAICR